MNKEEKQLLFRVLCEMLPYDCIVTIAEGGIDGLQWDNVTLNSYLLYQIEEEDALEYVKPYLRPMSSMTEDERLELSMLTNDEFKFYLYTNEPIIMCSGKDYNYLNGLPIFDWLNAHYFDYHDLIEKGLALEAPEGMYN